MRLTTVAPPAFAENPASPPAAHWSAVRVREKIVYPLLTALLVAAIVWSLYVVGRYAA